MGRVSVERLAIAGAFVVHADVFPDNRGSFYEAFHVDAVAQAVGESFSVAQTNVSLNRRGALRGIHFADVPPGQAKLIACVSGEILDVVVDLRVGSPTFGQVEQIPLPAADCAVVYLTAGLGHGFIATAPDTVVVYHVSSVYNPGAEHEINPFDPALGIDWPKNVAPLLSDKDRHAPSLAQAQERGLLPRYPGNS